MSKPAKDHYEHDFIEVRRGVWDILYECKECGLKRWNQSNDEYCTCVGGPRMVNPSDNCCCSCDKKDPKEYPGGY